MIPRRIARHGSSDQPAPDRTSPRPAARLQHAQQQDRGSLPIDAIFRLNSLFFSVSMGQAETRFAGLRAPPLKPDDITQFGAQREWRLKFGAPGSGRPAARPRTKPFACNVEHMTITRLDLSGLKCPLPALKTGKALKSLAPGDRLEVRCTDPMAAIDIPHLVASTGDRLEGIERGERDIVFHIEKSSSTLSHDPPY